jgi:hypothetical protein
MPFPRLCEITKRYKRRQEVIIIRIKKEKGKFKKYIFRWQLLREVARIANALSKHRLHLDVSEVGDFALLGGPPHLRLNPISADMQT